MVEQINTKPKIKGSNPTVTGAGREMLVKETL